MQLRFRTPGIPLSAADVLERVRPARGAQKAMRDGRLHFARPSGFASDWRQGAQIRELRAQIPAASALWLDDESEARAQLTAGESFELETPALPWPTGVVPVRGGSRFSFEVIETRGERALVKFACEGEGAARVLGWLAQAGSPALGDLAHGGSLARAGEPLFAREGQLRISEAARRALTKGHPWLTRDRESEDETRFAPGALVELLTEAGDSRGLARVEGGAQLVTRAWHGRTQQDIRARAPLGKPASIEERVARALARREKLRAEGSTDALRLVHGEADALPGLFVDRFGPLLRVLVAGRAALPLQERASAALVRALSAELGHEPSVVLVMQLRPQPPGELACVRQLLGPRLPEPLVVREGALSFRIDAGLAEPARPHPGVGFFPDQRANRARVAALVRPGGRYLNLFAHTGAFSAALLAAGAGEVVSVDLSAPYLARLEENLRLSSLPAARSRVVKRDARRFLDELAAAENFDGIVLDPPTAASAGGEFWSARQCMENLVAACLKRLGAGGFLLVTTNDRRSGGRLAERVEAAAAGLGCRVTVAPAGPAADFPSLKGFPKGVAFEGVLATRSA